MNKLLFIINPVSGGSDKEGPIETIRQVCKEKGVACNIVQTTGEADEKVIANAINMEQPDAVIACGGDGTINLTGQQLFGKNIPLGIIPLGSANGLATSMNLSADIQERIGSFLKNNRTILDVLKVNHQFYAFHLCSVGFNAELIHQREKSRQSGMMGYVRSFFKIYHLSRTRKYSIKTDTNQLNIRADMVTFANGDKYGTGAIINPSGKIDDGLFEVCIFKPFPWYAIFDLAFKFFTGRIELSPYTRYLQTKRAEVTSQKPALLEVDGDVKGRFEKITVEIMPGAVHLLV